MVTVSGSPPPAEVAEGAVRGAPPREDRATAPPLHLEQRAPLAPSPPKRHGWWWRTLAIGLVLWAAAVGVTMATSSSGLVPTVILLGSFLVPFSVALFAADRVTGTETAMRLLFAFGVGGVCGVLAATLLEAQLSSAMPGLLLVGAIEELVKGLLVVAIGWTVRPKTWAQGALLGATVGAGFAAFESSGYAFDAAITAQGIDIGSLVQTEIARALLSPVGHVLWTAVLGAVLFSVVTERHRFRSSWRVLVAFVGVALLHTLWDASGAIASAVALLLNHRALEFFSITGALPPTLAQQVESTSMVLYWATLALDGALGVAAMIVVGRIGRREERARPAP